MMKTFTLDNSATHTDIPLDNQSSVLSYSADLSSLTRVGVPMNEAQLTIDWSAVTTNMSGNPFEPPDISHVTVANFAKMNVDDLESSFLHLEEMADELYSVELNAVSDSIDLDMLVSADGVSFPGVDSNGTWIFALRCTATCLNTAPQFLTVLTPCE